MKRNTYYPSRVADQIIWGTNFRNKLASHATALGLTPAQVAAILADCDWLIYCLQTWLPAVRAWAQSGTDAIAIATCGRYESPGPCAGSSRLTALPKNKTAR